VLEEKNWLLQEDARRDQEQQFKSKKKAGCSQKKDLGRNWFMEMPESERRARLVAGGENGGKNCREEQRVWGRGTRLDKDKKGVCE